MKFWNFALVAFVITASCAAMAFSNWLNQDNSTCSPFPVETIIRQCNLLKGEFNVDTSAPVGKTRYVCEF